MNKYICIYIYPLIVLEEPAATRTENGLKLLSLFGKLEGTRGFLEGILEVHFLRFHACAVSGGPWKVFGSLAGSKWKEK